MIRALENSAMFFEGITETYVQSAGANIDDGGFEITINQSLLDGGGGLTKLGSGTLTLAGYNTYTGPTVVNEGTLETSANSFGGGGSLVVADAGNLKVTDAGSPVSATTRVPPPPKEFALVSKVPSFTTVGPV